MGSRGFLVFLALDASVLVAELPSGLSFGLLSEPGLRPGFFRAGGCCATVDLLEFGAILRNYQIMWNKFTYLQHQKYLSRKWKFGHCGVRWLAAVLLATPGLRANVAETKVQATNSSEA